MCNGEDKSFPEIAQSSIQVCDDLIDFKSFMYPLQKQNLIPITLKLFGYNLSCKLIDEIAYQRINSKFKQIQQIYYASSNSSLPNSMSLAIKENQERLICIITSKILKAAEKTSQRGNCLFAWYIASTPFTLYIKNKEIKVFGSPGIYHWFLKYHDLVQDMLKTFSLVIRGGLRPKKTEDGLEYIKVKIKILSI